MKYQHMNEKTFQPFEEFYKPYHQVEQKTEKEILNEVKDILSAFKKEGENVNGDI